jgi:thiamine kinase-like enzyme
MQFSEFCAPTQQACLPSLLDYLNHARPLEKQIWQGWVVEPVFGGQNNLVYHASHENGDFAVKFTRRDERHRAAREFNTLLALQRHGLDITPIPFALDDDRYAHSVVVQSWLEGVVSGQPPQTETEWQQLLAHLLLSQSLTPHNTAVRLPPATVHSTHPQEFLDYIKNRAASIPPGAHLAPLQSLFARLEKKSHPQWADPRRTLCHADPNLLNFVRRPQGWLAVDWENSGWGDPAFELADLLAHAAYIDVPMTTWQWFAAEYGERCGDDTAVNRIWAYYPYLLTFWVAIFTKALYDLENEIPNDRLAPRPSDWAETVPLKYNYYLALASTAVGN